MEPIRSIYAVASSTVAGRILSLSGRLVLVALCLVALSAQPAEAQDLIQIIKDINDDGLGADPSEFLTVQIGGVDRLFFTADDAENGLELWVSDKTPNGTAMVIDIYPGLEGSGPSDLTYFNDLVFFVADDGVHGRELWKTDGTSDGTSMVKDVYVGSGDSNPSYLVDAGGVLFFSATDGPANEELWTSTGWPAGTTMVKDIWAGGASHPRHLAAMGATVFFSASDGDKGRELWKSDGLSSGTEIVKDINDADGADSSPEHLTVMGGNLYFSANDGAHGTELWKSGGFDIDTAMVKDINPNAAGSSPEELTVMGGVLYFSAGDDTAGRELWKSDGIPLGAGTARVSDGNPGAPSGSPEHLTAATLTGLSEMLYYSLNNGVSGRELWSYSGSGNPTNLTNVSGSSSPTNLVAMGNKLYFSANDPTNGRELWAFTAGGAAAAIKDIYSGPAYSSPENLIALDGRVYFSADDGLTGKEMWWTDGTEAGTNLFKDIVDDQTEGSYPGRLAVMNGEVYFSADDGENGIELWKSDGTLDGTTIVQDIRPGFSHSTPEFLTEMGGELYFSANNGTSGVELWKSDGALTTELVTDLNDGAVDSSPQHLTIMDGILYFSADDGTRGRELWKSDGTGPNTEIVMNINPLAADSSPDELTVVNIAENGDQLFLAASDGGGRELWLHDGANTIRLTSNDVSPRTVAKMNGDVYFSGDDSTNGRELWKSDGTLGATGIVKDINPGGTDSNPEYLTAMGGELYFSANDGSNGVELWKSDGTDPGTVIVSAGGNSSPKNLTAVELTVGERLFFAADDGINGEELWISDGTPGGTMMLKDINPDGGNSYPQSMIGMNGLLIFRANDGTSGWELWASNGTEEGTVRVTDFNPGEGGSSPEHLTLATVTDGEGGDKELFFLAADDGEYGRELCTLENIAAPVAGVVESDTGTYTIENGQLKFTWNSFTGVEYYEVAFGIPDHPEDYVPFERIDTFSRTFLPEECVPIWTVFPEDQEFVCTVRAVNVIGMKSVEKAASVTVSTTALKLGEDIPLPDGKTWDDIDWGLTTFTPEENVIKIDYAQKLITGDSDNFSINWAYVGGGDFSRQYRATATPVQPAMIIYHTYDGSSPTGAPAVDLSSIPEVVIHYNSKIHDRAAPDESLWINLEYLNAREETGSIVLHYEEPVPTGPDDLIKIEIVEVKGHATVDADDGEADIGSRLLPFNDIPGAKATVMEGIEQEYIYQHEVPDSDQEGHVWSIKENDSAAKNKMLVIWSRPNSEGPEWPFELRSYKSLWPYSAPSKYQLYVRGRYPDELGPEVEIPESLKVEKQDYEDFDAVNHTAHLDLNTYYTDGPGWSLLKYEIIQTGWVGFDVVRSVSHNQGIASIPQDIGTEILDGYHEGPRGGYVHEPEGVLYAKDIYAGTEVPKTEGTEQVFGVNEGTIEVWWSHLSQTANTEGIQWPSLVKRYALKWPDAPEKIVIASLTGSGVLDPAVYSNSAVYYQNDPELPGFNPNDEHALVKPAAGGGGDAIYALRSDLGTPETSEPYVLLKYTDLTNEIEGKYGMKAYRVLAEGIDDDGQFYDFDYRNAMDDPVQPPYMAGSKFLLPNPLLHFGATVPSTPGGTDGSHGYMGPYWEDRKGSFWAKAAGDDGGDAKIGIRYFYPYKKSEYGFFTPYAPEPADNEGIPWLDREAGETLGTPTDVTYDIGWPADLPVLQIGCTLMEPGDKGFDMGLPEIDGQLSVEIIYQQAMALEGKEAVKLIDPLIGRTIDISESPYNMDDGLPSEIRTGSVSGVTTFVDLPPSLQMRLFYHPNDRLLEFRGDYVRISLSNNLLLPNVMTLREKNTILELSIDGGFQSAVEALYDASKQITEIMPETTFWRSMALSTAWAEWANEEGGYITLAMANHSDPEVVDPGEQVALYIIRVKDAFFPGSLIRVIPPGGFDERLTLVQSNDFAGNPDAYQFEWMYQAAVSGSPPDFPEEGDAKGWTLFDLADRPNPAPEITDNSVGASSITIGESNTDPPLLILADHWHICRYKLADPTLVDYPNKDGWSDWTYTFAPGWVKRVLGEFGPFEQPSGGGIDGAEQKFSQFHMEEVNTVVSMLRQAGRRWEGDIALNAGSMDDKGLIELYQTVLNRAMNLSVNAIPPVIGHEAVDKALFLAAGRIADLYMLLGNEAYADAQDPTIGFGLDSGQQYSAQASHLHAFMNETASLLDEELALLCGRDPIKYGEPAVTVGPLYNRLPWNFTGTSDIMGGEVAYALNYAIEDILGNADGSPDGRIDILDAEAMYPQGHGDAWGHYLSSIKTYYKLLRHNNVVWRPRDEAIPLGASQVTVGLLHERKFAKAAAAKARTGAEIVNLTYRQAFVEDPEGQYQGYRDEEPDRSWGLSEWGSRTGQGTYFDWVVGNAVIPPIDNEHTGVAKIDRTTVAELREVAGAVPEIQAAVDKADNGLNPLGLARNFIPFDISPSELDGGKSHFEQIYARAAQAMSNAITVFNHANRSTQLIRRQMDDVSKFGDMVADREADFNNRLIEIFGYPYGDDIGKPGATYDFGYDGPDVYHHDYFDPVQLLGVEDPGDIEEYDMELRTVDVEDFGQTEAGDLTGGIKVASKSVSFHMSTIGFGHVKPADWTLTRRAPGELQFARSELMQASYRFQRAMKEYDELLLQIEGMGDDIRAEHDLNASEINIMVSGKDTQQSLNDKIKKSQTKQFAFRTAASAATIIANAAAEFLPLINGIDNDYTSVVRGGIETAGAVTSGILNALSDAEGLTELDHQQAKEMAQLSSELELTSLKQSYAIDQKLGELAQMVRQEPIQRLELYTLHESLVQLGGRYLATLARGQRILEDRLRFRLQTASSVQEYRYRDMAFRIFRNDAIQKYRAQFDLAGMYVYMTAAAYDYETAFLKGDPYHPGQNFMTNITKARSLGEFGENGTPIQAGPNTGDPGLADPLARLFQNWQHLTTTLGFNNPRARETRFSIRQELFRISPGAMGADVWAEQLGRSVVSNIRDIPEFERLAKIPFQYDDVEPGIVISFQTSIVSGANFFGIAPKAPGENSYNATLASHKIRSAGVWFSNYDNLSMINDPQIYLIPVGVDILRSPSANNEDARREWTVVEQKLPAPFVLDAGSLGE
ncbi:ELWxxDGT repeat protein, partial [Candidatus Hydrogenedentota bacterium]